MRSMRLLTHFDLPVDYNAVLLRWLRTWIVRIVDMPKNSQWSGESPSCTPITCGTTPEAFGNGRYDTGGHVSIFQYSQSILPQCNAEFYLQRGTERRFNEVYLWSCESPVCSPITCLAPNSFINGRYNGSQTNYAYGTVLMPFLMKASTLRIMYETGMRGERQVEWGYSGLSDCTLACKYFGLYLDKCLCDGMNIFIIMYIFQ